MEYSSKEKRDARDDGLEEQNRKVDEKQGGSNKGGVGNHWDEAAVVNNLS
jgi:hypothetical protein